MVQVAGVPPIIGSTIRANIGWTTKSSAAERRTAAVNNTNRTRGQGADRVSAVTGGIDTGRGPQARPPPRGYFLTYFFTALGPTSAP